MGAPKGQVKAKDGSIVLKPGQVLRNGVAAWSDEIKADALKVYEAEGLKVASEKTGVPKDTIWAWGRAGGVSSRRVQNLSEAVRVLGLDRRRKKLLIANELLDLAAEFLTRVRRPVTETRVSGNGTLVQWPEKAPLPADVKHLVTAAAIALDKSALLSGEATGRTEHVDVTELERMLTEAIKDPVKRKALAVQVLQAHKAGSRPQDAVVAGTLTQP